MDDDDSSLINTVSDSVDNTFTFSPLKNDYILFLIRCITMITTSLLLGMKCRGVRSRYKGGGGQEVKLVVPGACPRKSP